MAAKKPLPSSATITASEAGRRPSLRAVPEGDNRERMICTDCGFVLYDNPKIVVGSVARWGERILLCRRSIHPRRGYWTLPAGYLELNESTCAGAEREAWPTRPRNCASSVFNGPRASRPHAREMRGGPCYASSPTRLRA